MRFVADGVSVFLTFIEDTFTEISVLSNYTCSLSICTEGVCVIGMHCPAAEAIYLSERALALPRTNSRGGLSPFIPHRSALFSWRCLRVIAAATACRSCNTCSRRSQQIEKW